jgi:hypothetical protein
MALFIILVVLLAVFYWLVKRPKGRPRPVPRRGEVDDETLAAAEDEVRDVDPFASPEEAEEELRDWGPGAPK